MKLRSPPVRALILNLEPICIHFNYQQETKQYGYLKKASKEEDAGTENTYTYCYKQNNSRGNRTNRFNRR